MEPRKPRTAVCEGVRPAFNSSPEMSCSWFGLSQLQFLCDASRSLKVTLSQAHVWGAAADTAWSLRASHIIGKAAVAASPAGQACPGGVRVSVNQVPLWALLHGVVTAPLSLFHVSSSPERPLCTLQDRMCN
ncbi:hypothetical protein CB1_000932090 [Camelus ferus]|nr:hypothetical protein CB1_000932090 [Camelus ferus]